LEFVVAMIFPRRLMRYGAAMGRWIAAGRPVRSDVLVQEIFETFCRPCPSYDPSTESCRLCGCRVAPAGPACRNKIRMATERCPAEPPRWQEEKQG
jgi:hypothetical protein